MGEGERERTGEYEETRTPVEEVLAGIWAEVLKVERVGAEENFFEMGGHSLLATQVMSRVREGFRVEIALRELFEHPTVRELGERIEEELRGGAGKGGGRIERVSREGLMPLSFAQQRLWFIDQLEPGSPFYNISTGIRLNGQLSVEVFEQTLTEIVRRHESWRTTFAMVDNKPVQVIAPPGPVSLPMVDLSHLAEAGRDAETQRLAMAEALKPFDLMKGPLLRVKLLRLGENEHIVLFTVHHIISDGWSMGVLVREVAALYRAFLAGEPSPLAELPIQYADYAHWQREWLQGEVLERQLAYWQRMLGDAPSSLELPADRPHLAEPSYRGASESFMLTPEMSQALKALSRREGATLYMTLLAAFQTLLYRYSGQEDIVVSTSIAGRPRVETESLLGFFVNTLLIRADLSGSPGFRELLSQVRETTLGAYAHQDVPFEKVVEALHADRDPGRLPLTQVMFVLQNTPQQGGMELPGLILTPLGGKSPSASFDLVLFMEEGDRGLVATFQYSTDIFDASTVKQMVKYFRTLLESIINNPDEEVSSIAISTEDEMPQMIEA
jgi:acyl carrier protein